MTAIATLIVALIAFVAGIVTSLESPGRPASANRGATSFALIIGSVVALSYSGYLLTS